MMHEKLRRTQVKTFKQFEEELYKRIEYAPLEYNQRNVSLDLFQAEYLLMLIGSRWGEENK